MIDFLLELMRNLKEMPGFRFVDKYYYALYLKVQNIQDKRGDMEDRVGGFRQGLNILKKAPQAYKGSKKKR